MKYPTFLVLLLLVSLQVESSVKIVSYNIRNFDYRGSSTNKPELKKIMEDLKFDLLGAQEIVNKESFKSFIKKDFPDYEVALSRCGGGGKQKLGIVYKKSRFKLNKLYEDNRLSDPGSVVSEYGCGRLRPALVGFFTDTKLKKDFVVVVVHLKAGGQSSSYSKRKAQYQLLTKVTDELRLADHKNIIMIGDFNTTGYVDSDQDYKNFSEFLRRSGFRTGSENIQCTSYWSGRNRNDNIEESSILDHIVYPKKFLEYSSTKVEVHSHCAKVSCTYTSSSALGLSYKQVSDHCPVSLIFE